MLVGGVEIAEFVEACGDVGEIGQALDDAGAGVAFMAGRGGAGGDGHAGLVKFFVEDVHMNFATWSRMLPWLSTEADPSTSSG